MRLTFGGLIVLIFFSSLVFSQDSLRRQRYDELKQITSQLKILNQERKRITEQQLDVLLKLKSVSAEDSAEAAKLGAKAIRLFPCCELEKLADNMDELDSTNITFREQARFGALSFSSYQIADLMVDENSRTSYEGSTTFEYSQNSLSFSRPVSGNHGFIFDLGKTAFENVGEQTKEVAALADYQAPTDEENIRKELVSKGITFGQSMPVTVGNTYILRVVKYTTIPINLDAIFAVKVHRINKEGSIILFIKPIKIFEPPKLKDPEREESDRVFNLVFNLGLVAKLKEELDTKGFKDIQVEVVDKVITLKGTVPTGKTAEAIEIAKNISYGVKVKSELEEK